MDTASGELRIFAYGSLMWDPEYVRFEICRALLQGYARSFCVWTVHARGTPAMPGLALGLRRASSAECYGTVLSLNTSTQQLQLEALWEREIWTGIYRPEWVIVSSGKRSFRAVTFVVDEDHPQYAGVLPQAELAQHIAQAKGVFGTCRDYFYQSIRSLSAVNGERDEFADLETQVRKVMAQGDLD